MKILKLCLLFFITFQWLSCINDGNFGGNYTDDCNGNNTEVSFEARDFYTNEPLGGIPFKIYSQYVGISIYGNDMLSEVSAFKTTQNGSARNLFSHDKGGYYVYYLAVDSTQNNFLTNSYWGIPAGCLTTYNIRLKPIKKLQISLKNSLGHDLESFNLFVDNVSPYKKINSIFQPETLQLGNFYSLIFEKDKTQDLDFKCLPEEPTRISYSYQKDGRNIQKDTTFQSSRSDEIFTINLN
jgi:hypothetical protein